MVEPSAEKERFVFKVMYRAGENENVKPPQLTLEIREGAEGEWKDSGVAVAGGGMEVDDPESIRAGREYSFRIRSTTSSASNVALPDDQKTLYSQESDPVLLQPSELIAALSVGEGDHRRHGRHSGPLHH